MTGPAGFTYDEVGATRREPLPAGYRHLTHAAPVASGRAGFQAAAEALLTWRMQRAAGAEVSASAPRAAPGVAVTLRLRFGPRRVAAPCRVVWTEDQPHRAGFACGTLPGHPATGEESFVLTTDDSGTVWLTVRAFSRPASRLMRLAGPVAPRFQRRYARRCATALRHLAAVGPDRAAGTTTGWWPRVAAGLVVAVLVAWVGGAAFFAAVNAEKAVELARLRSHGVRTTGIPISYHTEIRGGDGARAVDFTTVRFRDQSGREHTTDVHGHHASQSWVPLVYEAKHVGSVKAVEEVNRTAIVFSAVLGTLGAICAIVGLVPFLAGARMYLAHRRGAARKGNSRGEYGREVRDEFGDGPDESATNPGSEAGR